MSSVSKESKKQALAREARFVCIISVIDVVGCRLKCISVVVRLQRQTSAVAPSRLQNIAIYVRIENTVDRESLCFNGAHGSSQQRMAGFMSDEVTCAERLELELSFG